MFNIVRLNPDHPYRPVSWRWERARFLRENHLKLINRKYDDADVLRARKFQLELEQCRSDVDHALLSERDISLYYAYNLYDEEEYDTGRLANPGRYEIEARLLAGEPISSIAQRMCTTSEVIIQYEKIFFNVLDRLSNKSYILHQVMGESVHRGLSDRNYDILWKLYGYYYGVHVLDSIITTCTNPSRIERPEQVDAFYVDEARSSMRRKSALAARTLPINTFTQIPIVELHTKLLEIEQNVDTGNAQNAMLSSIAAMMDQIPWSVGNKSLETMDSSMVPYYDDNQAGELRSDEILALTNNVQDKIPDLDKMKELKLPEAETKI